jgi:hypothetical protein
MAQDDLTRAEHVDNPEVHHEESDVNVRAIVMFAVWLTVAAAVIHLLVWGIFVFFDRREAQTAGDGFPLAAGQEQRVPPEPRLQTAPRLELQDLRAREEEALTSYGWVDQAAGTVRIPIEQAKRLLLQRGLPSRAAAAPAADTAKPPAETGTPATGRGARP